MSVKHIIDYEKLFRNFQVLVGGEKMQKKKKLCRKWNSHVLSYVHFVLPSLTIKLCIFDFSNFNGCW